MIPAPPKKIQLPKECRALCGNSTGCEHMDTPRLIPISAWLLWKHKFFGTPFFFFWFKQTAPFADIRHQDTLVLLIWRNLPGRVVWLLWIYTFVPCISRSFHPMVLLEPFWRLQACCCPSLFDIWLISLYRNIVVSETTSAAPFLLTTEGSSRHSLNSVSRASWLSDDTLSFGYWFSIETRPSFVTLTLLFWPNSFLQVLSHSGLLFFRLMVQFLNPVSSHGFRIVPLWMTACLATAF